MMVDLVGCGSAESGVNPVAVVPEAVERQFLLHGGETVRNSDKSPGAFVLDGADAAFDHGEAAILADGAKPLPDTATGTPALELRGGKLAALVRDKVLGLMAPEQAPQKPSHKSRGGLTREDSEAHDAARGVIDGHSQPPAERPNLR